MCSYKAWESLRKDTRWYQTAELHHRRLYGHNSTGSEHMSFEELLLVIYKAQHYLSVLSR